MWLPQNGGVVSFLVKQCCRSGSKLEPYSETLWIRIHTGKNRTSYRQNMQDWRQKFTIQCIHYSGIQLTKNLFRSHSFLICSVKKILLLKKIVFFWTYCTVHMLKLVFNIENVTLDPPYTNWATILDPDPYSMICIWIHNTDVLAPLVCHWYNTTLPTPCIPYQTIPYHTIMGYKWRHWKTFM